MRGISATSNSSITSPLRTLSNTGSPRASIIASPPTPASPGFSTITFNRSSGSNTNGDSKNDSNGDTQTPQPLDLNQEVAALSNKLIKAINHQTMLDDSLASTKHELELSKARIQQLEAVARDHEQMMAKGLLVDRKDMETEHAQFVMRLREEKSQRSKAERDKKTIEQELEHLTTALFEEANKMVAAARKERDMMDRKNEQLKAQLADTEMLLQSHQEQLSELKQVMQQMTAEREDHHEISFSIPSSPALNNRGSKESLGMTCDSVSMSPSYSNQPDELMAPTYPTSFSQLITPVLRHDTPAYQDFLALLRSPKPQAQSIGATTLAQPSPSVGGTSGMYRLSTGSMTSFQVIGMGMGISAITSYTPHHSPTTSVSNGPLPSTPSTPSGPPPVPLKETRFYKRVLVDDIEPTLRLDLAPGLSWLARRNTLSALTEGTLIIDPIPPSSRINMMVCTLCGESRNEDPLHIRTHRMRTSETDNAQKYPLCGYCVSRVRATCDFVGFLRLCKDGLWKCEGEQDEKHAWEVCTGHRERMFWGRIGGGVVPTVYAQHYQGYYQGSVFGGRNSLEYGGVSGLTSPRKVSWMSTSTRGGMEKSRSSVESQREGEPATPPPPPPPKTPEPSSSTASSPAPKSKPPLPPVVPPKKAATEPPPQKKDPSLSPLRRIWSLGANRMLGGDRNKALPSLTTTLERDTMKSISEEKEKVGEGNKENVPPAQTDSPGPFNPATSNEEPQTPAFEREIQAARRLGKAASGMDSPSSTRAVFTRERGDSVVSVAGTVVYKALEGEKDERQREWEQIEEQREQEEEAEREREREEKREKLKEVEEERKVVEEWKEKEEAERREAEMKQQPQQRKEEEETKAERWKVESPALPGGWD